MNCTISVHLLISSVSYLLRVYIRIYCMFLPVSFHIDGLARNHRCFTADALELRGLALTMDI